MLLTSSLSSPSLFLLVELFAAFLSFSELTLLLFSPFPVSLDPSITKGSIQIKS